MLLVPISVVLSACLASALPLVNFHPFARKLSIPSEPFRKAQVAPCMVGLPNALSFTEPLSPSVRPDQVVIFTGGDSLQRRSSGFGLLSAQSILDMAAHQGYRVVFLDQVDYDKSLEYGGYKFKPEWHRVFALPAIRLMFPDAKYFIQMDDDILVPYEETDMLNHYINMMEKNPEWLMTYAEDGECFVMNAGFFFMKNADFCFDFYQRVIEVGLENNGHLAHNKYLEQDAAVLVRSREHLEHQIQVLPHRKGPYNFNTFARDNWYDPEGARIEYGDAFVHFLDQPPADRLRKMNKLNGIVNRWRSDRPDHCSYPVSL